MEVDEVKEQMEKLKLDVNEQKLLNNIYDFESYLKKELLNKTFTTNKDFDKYMEEKSRELLENYLGLQKNHSDTMAKKDDEDTINFLVNNKKSTLKKDLLNELKKKYNIKKKKELAKYIVDNKIEPYYSEALKATRTNLEDFRYKNILFDSKVNQVDGSGELISFNKLKDKIIKNKLNFYFVYYHYTINNNKTYKIDKIIIFDIYKFDFSQTSGYLGQGTNVGSVYYNKDLIMNARQKKEKFTIEEIEEQLEILQNKKIQKILEDKNIKKIIDDFDKKLKDTIKITHPFFTLKPYKDFFEDCIKKENKLNNKIKKLEKKIKKKDEEISLLKNKINPPLYKFMKPKKNNADIQADEERKREAMG